MDYEVKKRPGFILVTVTRRVTTEMARSICETIPALAREWGVSNVLIDVQNIPSPTNDIERYQYAVQLAQHFGGLAVAFVRPQSYHDPRNFGETVAVNRGANLRVCSTLDEAYDWLGVQPADRPDSGDSE